MIQINKFDNDLGIKKKIEKKLIYSRLVLIFS